MRVHNEVQTDAGNSFKDQPSSASLSARVLYNYCNLLVFKVFFFYAQILFILCFEIKDKHSTHNAATSHNIRTYILCVCLFVYLYCNMLLWLYTTITSTNYYFYVCAIFRHLKWFVTPLPRHYCSLECTEWITAHAFHISDRYYHIVLLSIVAAHLLIAKSTVNLGTTVVGCTKNVQFSLWFVNVYKPNRITEYKHFFNATLLCYTVVLGQIERRLHVII